MKMSDSIVFNDKNRVLYIQTFNAGGNMKDMIFALSEREQYFKEKYENGQKELFKNPMSYHQYEKITKGKDKYYDKVKIYHEDISVNNPGNTIKEVSRRGDNVEVVLHSRYSYPLMHNHAYIELVYIYSGQCTHFVEQQSFIMKQGDVCILAPNAMHAVAVQSDDVIIINIMMSKKMFDLAFIGILKGGHMISEFLEHILYNKKVSPYIIFPTDKDNWMQETVMKIYKERNEKKYLYKESINLYVRQLFIHLIRHYEMMAIVSNPIDNCHEHNIIALMGYITVNYNHVTLSQVAQFFGYNETYLGQIIQKYTNKNFCALITDLQMKNAKRFLEESNMNITQISNEIGCYDASHFNRKFKSAYGITPNMYRKRNNMSY